MIIQKNKNIIGFSLFVFFIIFFLGSIMYAEAYTCKQCCNDACATYSSNTPCESNCVTASDCYTGTYTSKICTAGMKCVSETVYYDRPDSCTDDASCSNGTGTYSYFACNSSNKCVEYESNYSYICNACNSDQTCQDEADSEFKKYCHGVSAVVNGTVKTVWSCIAMNPADATGYKTCSTAASCEPSTVGTKYACKTNYAGTWFCEEDSNGNYSTLSSCNANCGGGGSVTTTTKPQQWGCLYCDWDHGGYFPGSGICGKKYFNSPCTNKCRTDADCEELTTTTTTTLPGVITTTTTTTTTIEPSEKFDFSVYSYSQVKVTRPSSGSV